MAESNNKKDNSENNKVIDFTVIKLKQLVKHYKREGMIDIVVSIEYALHNYTSGLCHIKWHNGLPYCRAIEPVKSAE